MMRVIFLIFILSFQSLAFSPDWSQSAIIPKGENRENIYKLSVENFNDSKRKGFIHAFNWPVEVSGLLIPYDPLKNFLNGHSKNPVKKIGKWVLGFKDMNDLYSWLGINDFPREETLQIPFPNHVRPEAGMGASLIKKDGVKALTFSCATCHSGTLFGKSVMGLTNKRPRANDFFVMAKKIVPKVPSHVFKATTKASEEERLLFKRSKDNLKSVGMVAPQVLGLDTSLPHVALSLAKRKRDQFASKSWRHEIRPRKNKLEKFVADSKPMPWWNLKYKTRWLSDGSIVSGNPILTNFLWNEIGRGTDLKELEVWMKDNQEKIEEITVAAFSTKAPHWTDFFEAKTINLDKAKIGQKIFNQSCKKCHGEYLKSWDRLDADSLSEAEKLKTYKVIYHEQTPVKNVGTDPNRWMAMKEFADDLNRLQISKWMKTVVVPQKGYVPPPLVGIFARYPYFHNNSIPNLCALMQRPDKRPTFFVQGPSLAKSDYDEDCVGYPVGSNIPKSWLKDKDAHFSTNRPGLRNTGHSRVFYNKDGLSLMSVYDKKALREFLKTL